MSKRASPTDAALKALRAFGLAYPGAHTKSPWPGHLDLAVKDKTFAYLSLEGDPFSIGCKLPHGNALALELPFVMPTPYGLGKSGWVTAKLPPGEAVPVEMFQAWIDESYRAQAPKKLIAELDAKRGEGPANSPPKKTAPKRTAPKKAAPKKTAPKKATKKATPKKR